MVSRRRAFAVRPSLLYFLQPALRDRALRGSGIFAEGAALSANLTGSLSQDSAASAPVIDWSAVPSGYRDRYRSAKPWPHLVLDQLIDPHVVREAEGQEAAQAPSLTLHKSHRQVKAESRRVSGPAAQQILDGLVSTEMVEFLRDLTNIPTLVGDPTFCWAGIQAGQPGSFVSVHNDFRRHPVSRLYHRVNVLVYLNSSWEESYGGHLEMWTRDLRSCGQRISPIAGRTVIFETDADTYHAVPEPLTCPDDRWRLTLASYYYSETPSASDRRRPYVRRPRRPQDPWRTAFVSPRSLVVNRWRWRHRVG